MYYSFVKLLNTKDAGQILGISAIRVRDLINAGRLPAQKIGRDYVIDEKDLELVRERKAGRPKNKTVEENK
jgi:excisionase family DNA binding protein